MAGRRAKKFTPNEVSLQDLSRISCTQIFRSFRSAERHKDFTNCNAITMMMIKTILALLVATTTTLSAFDLPSLKSHLFLDDDNNGDIERRSLSEIPTGSCLSNFVDLDFNYSSLKAGFDDLTVGPLIFESIDADGLLDLKIEAVTAYVPANAADNNGYACAPGSTSSTGASNGGCASAHMYQLNLQQGQSTTFRFTILNAGTTTPATITTGVRFSVFDIDSGASAGVETYTIADWTNALFWDDVNPEASFVVSSSPNTLVASATQTGRGCGKFESLSIPPRNGTSASQRYFDYPV